MTRYRQTLFVLLLAMFSGVAVAQNNTNSPYTRYGYGQLADQGTGNSKAMGGVAYGLRDKYQVNFANPASYTAVDSLTFIFDGGISLQNTNFSNGTLKQNAKNSSFDYITMQFRTSKWSAVSIGLLPYANVGYNIGEYHENTEYPNASYTTQYGGEGGLHQIYLGAGFKILKNLSVGANISYLWGDVTRGMTQKFPNNAAAYPFMIENNVSIKSYKLDFGLQYTQKLAKKHELTLGVVYSPGHNLSNKAYELRQNGDGNSGTTVSKEYVEADYGIPSTYGAGLAYMYDSRLTVGLDAMFQDWDKVAYENKTDVFCKRMKVALGAEMIPNPMGRSYLSNIRYRIGTFYSKPYYKIAGERAANEYGVTAGFGFPVMRTRSMINISAQYVKTQGTQAAFLDESTFRVCVGITFNERWFFKRKVE